MSDSKALIFRLNDTGLGPELVRQVFLEQGWQEFEDDVHEEWEWNLWWKTSKFRAADYEQLMTWQRLNHYPKTDGITKKDCLARNLRRMRGVYGSGMYNFSPIAFNLPNDYKRFVAEYTKLKQKDIDKDHFWICKPADLSRGRGIFIFRELSELQYDCNAVAQKYITNPLLISGYKFDLRIYVNVPSFNPLYVYVFREGLVRFGTEKYDLTSLNNLFSHLTNSSINKYGPSYSTDKEQIGPGCKWTLTQLRQYFHRMNIDDSLLWTRITNIIILTLIPQAPQVPSVNHCFELYGFDVLIDENMKPWLLEVNFSPALTSDCQIDVIVKKPMLHDLLEMCNLLDQDREHGGEAYRQYKHKTSQSPTHHYTGRQSNISRLLRKSSRLPNINFNSSTSSLSSMKEIGSSSVTLAEGEDSDSEYKPLVPGCGLPSIQQPQRCESPCISDVSSGGSSAGSGHNSKMCGKKHGTKPMGNIEDSRVSMQGKRQVGKPTKSTQSLKSVQNREKQTAKMPLPINNASNHLDSLGISDDSLQRQAQLIEERKQLNSQRWQRSQSTQSSQGSRMTNGMLFSLTDQSLTAKKPKEKSNELMNDRNPAENHTSAEGRRGLSKSMNGANRQTSFVGNSRTERRITRRKSQSSLGSNPAVQKSIWNARGGATSDIRSRSPLAKKTVGHFLTQGLSQHSSKPPQQVGDFVLTFPFNDATRKCCGNNFDLRVIIRECQKVLKQKINEVQKKKKTGCDIHIPPGDKIADTPVLWGPIKIPEPDTA